MGHRRCSYVGCRRCGREAAELWRPHAKPHEALPREEHNMEVHRCVQRLLTETDALEAHGS